MILPPPDLSFVEAGETVHRRRPDPRLTLGLARARKTRGGRPGRHPAVRLPFMAHGRAEDLSPGHAGRDGLRRAQRGARARSRSSCWCRRWRSAVPLLVVALAGAAADRRSRSSSATTSPASSAAGRARCSGVEFPSRMLPREGRLPARMLAWMQLARRLAGALLRARRAAVRRLGRRACSCSPPGAPRWRSSASRCGAGRRPAAGDLFGWELAYAASCGAARRRRRRRRGRRALARARRRRRAGGDGAPAARARRAASASPPASTRSRRPARAWSRPPTPSAGGSSATSTTARSSGSSRWR